MKKFLIQESLLQFQNFINDVYSLPDDRLFSISDLLSNQERFTMRALKGIRKGDKNKLRINLLIAFSWLMAVANRFHINVEEEVWRRFPAVCSYCRKQPCVCKKTHPSKRKKIISKRSFKPRKLSDFQKMFFLVYPPGSRTLYHAGVHLAEEMGELSEAIHYFLGEHKNRQFEEIKNEIADYTSCVFGVANSAGIELAKELAKIYYKNCHVCHKIPCVCKFYFVANL